VFKIVRYFETGIEEIFIYNDVKTAEKVLARFEVWGDFL